jgi:hypothetical protein
VLGEIVKRAFHGVVLFFAIIAFLRVPIGGHTGLEHVLAIFSTPPAREAGAALADAAEKLAERAREQAAALGDDDAKHREPASARDRKPAREPR